MVYTFLTYWGVYYRLNGFSVLCLLPLGWNWWQLFIAYAITCWNFLVQNSKNRYILMVYTFLTYWGVYYRLNGFCVLCLLPLGWNWCYSFLLLMQSPVENCKNQKYLDESKLVLWPFAEVLTNFWPNLRRVYLKFTYEGSFMPGSTFEISVSI